MAFVWEIFRVSIGCARQFLIEIDGEGVKSLRDLDQWIKPVLFMCGGCFYVVNKDAFCGDLFTFFTLITTKQVASANVFGTSKSTTYFFRYPRCEVRNPFLTRSTSFISIIRVMFFC